MFGGLGILYMNCRGDENLLALLDEHATGWTKNVFAWTNCCQIIGYTCTIMLYFIYQMMMITSAELVFFYISQFKWKM